MAERNAKERRVLDPARVVLTLDQLHARIAQRFPAAGLARVCGDLIETARKTQKRARDLGRPYIGLRLLTLLVVVAAVGLQVYAARLVDWSSIGRRNDTISLTQGLESAVNLALLAGGALWFLARWETRLKRARILRHLYELRSFAHVIDMHQLTKDPSVVLKYGDRATPASPPRLNSEFELARYLDYCSEMLALTAKLAALYAAHTHDGEVMDAVNDVEMLTAELGRKIWQKITILSQLREVEEAGGPSIEG
jgi:hypothetical protein